ncbi:PLD nuclease N-terminal domain-containing protein [Lutibacter sp.]|jgi:heme/copper-type cytochrome/quinol oxidase subunit 4|uniref:PLD nuclease N-terminal domain-containing protein n=1 Tax=Lutibacter sp. TaxID=1925666 RepID=UPI001A21BE47|nr:PLD nuclease N-terminal domain-containing protein [Lutibacter sp.]MBI9039950.1 PLDc_N domain-containing protein [Lutibacter sp.]
MIELGMIGPFQIMVIFGVIFLLGIIPTIIALIDILKNEFEGNNKIVWVLVVLFLNLIGAILYFVIGRNQKIKS